MTKTLEKAHSAPKSQEQWPSAADTARYWEDMRLKDRLDRNSERFESRKKGRAEGIADVVTKVTKSMRAKGFDNAAIAQITELPLAEIERL